MYHVIIVEDDPMVAAINRHYLSSDPHFQLDQCFPNGSEALAYLEDHPVDLAIVDYYMPVMDGAKFLLAMHGKGYHPAVIMITAANYATEVTQILSLGVLDYIVKPFTFERFQAALQKFLKTNPLRSEETLRLSQEDIDQLMGTMTAGTPQQADTGVKGIQSTTLELLRDWMRSHEGSFLTSDEISKQVQLSRITVRRYLNYMLENHEIISRMDYTTGGRPSLRYCISPLQGSPS